MPPDHSPDSGLITWSPSPLPDPPRSVADVLGPVLAVAPDRLALIDGDRRWTYDELDRAIDSAGRRLTAAGLDKDEVLLWSSPNCAELVIAFLATQRLGAVWAAVSPKASAAERARAGELLDPRVAILGLDTYDDLAEGPTIDGPASDPLAPAAIGFTSGSTGTPKAVVHSQHGLLVPAHVSRSTEPPAADERIGTPLALTTLNMLVLGPLSAFVRGTTSVIMTRTDPDGFAADIQAHRVTRAFVVPTILHDLVRDVRDPDRLASLDRVIAGAAGARPEVIRDFVDRFQIRPTLSYGLSEAPTGVVRESVDDAIGSGRGFPLPHVEVTTAADGEIVVGPATTGPWADVWTPMLGYLGDSGATAEALRGRRLYTGDIGDLDDDGALHVLGRRGHLINRGGELISPQHVVTVLESQPEIAEAAVVGVSDDRLGEVVAALVVLAPGAAVPDLVDLLPRSHRPAIIEQADALPRLAMGKVDLAEVRRRLGG